MIGSLFSGLGGLEEGLVRAGLGPVAWQCEIDPFCREVLAKHWPNVRRYTDVRSLRGADLAPVRVLCGGFPCQDLSSAGKRAGLDGARSGLWFEFRRLVEELAPEGVVVENVRGLTGRALDTVVTGLCDLGYQVEGTLLRASDLGAPHLRARTFLVAVADARRERRGLEPGRGSGQDGPRGDEPDGRGPRGRSDGQDPYEGWSEYGQPVGPVAYPDGGRREDERSGAGEGGRPLPVRGSRPGPSQPAVGGESDGVRPGLDGPGPRGEWPCPRGSEGRVHGEAGYLAPQHSWEAPRTAVGVVNSGKRRKALGNAVCPQQAYVAGLRLRQLLEAR